MNRLDALRLRHEAAERQHAFLDPRAARVVQADDGRAKIHREIHDLHDLRGVGFGKRSAEDREVLREGEHLAAVNQTMPGDDTVAGDDLAGHAEVEAAVRDEPVEFFEGARIEEEIDPFAGREFSRIVLALPALFAAAELGAALEIGEDLVRRQAFTACDFSQSFRNFSRPMFVSGWL